MKRLFLFLAAFVALVAAPLNAFAATYIQDNGNMFSSGAKNQATKLIDGLRQRTGKEMLILTVPSLNGQDAAAAADNAFRQNRVNGVLFFASRDDRKLEIVVGQDTKQALPDARAVQIRQTMLNDFRANNQQGFDKGLIDGVNEVRSTLGAAATSGRSATTAAAGQRGPNWVVIGLLVLVALLVAWVIAGIVRARRQQPYFSYGQQQQQQQPGAPGYGAPGYGGGPGFGGGGGFFGGLMGGIGGALLGNALFDAFRPRDRFGDNYGGGGGSDAGFQDQGWQGNDAGQVGDTTGGSWGDSGGSGDSGGGGGDSGGGGGDSGGGGGDSGGGGGGGGDW